MKKKKILMLVCMAVLAVTVVIPVNAAKKTNKKQIQVLNLYQDQKTDIEEAEYHIHSTYRYDTQKMRLPQITCTLP